MAKVLSGKVTVEFSAEEFSALLYVAGNVSSTDMATLIQADGDDQEKRQRICYTFVKLYNLGEP